MKGYHFLKSMWNAVKIELIDGKVNRKLSSISYRNVEKVIGLGLSDILIGYIL